MRNPSASFLNQLASATARPAAAQGNLAGRNREVGLGHCRGLRRARIRTVVLALLGGFLAPHLAGGGEAPTPPAGTGAVQVLVACYSRTGNTEQMARGVVEGIQRVPGAVAVLKKVGEVSKEDLQSADGIVLGCPTYFANLPGEMKTILDDWNWKLKVDFTDKVGGAFATAGGQMGGQGHVVTSLLLFMLHNRMVVAGPLYQNEKTGSVWAESGAAAVTGPLDPGVGESELDGARRLGERIASVAKKMKSSSKDLRIKPL
jgi:NAD(P)H dehydrogenase (quinone)